MNAFPESFSGDLSEERKNSDVAGADAGYAAEQKNYDQKCGGADCDQAQKASDAVTPPAPITLP